MKISACWIAKNETENVRVSIESVKDCADELIVVDTGSTDDTVYIAGQCGARVEHFVWANDFSAARNYALSLASGEIVIFIDADEYFDPALTKADGDRFRRIFEETKADVIGIQSIKVEKEDGSASETYISERIFRRAAIRYENKIHESPRLISGEIPKWTVADGYILVHTGYSRANITEKLKRNLEILEVEKIRLKSPLKLYMNAMYLMRESLYLEDFDKAAEHCLYLLSHHDYFGEAVKNSPSGCLRCFHSAIHVVEMRRGKFSRKEVYAKLFGAVKEFFPGIRDALLAELHYQLRFDYREERFLRELEAVESMLQTTPFTGIPDSRLVESRIFEQASEAAHLRGDTEKTKRWVLHAIQYAQIFDPRLLQLLLYCMKDDPPQETARFLTETLDLSRENIAPIAAELLNTEEYHAVCKILQEKECLPAVIPRTYTGRKKAVGAREVGQAEDFLTKAERLFTLMRYAEIAADPRANREAAIDKSSAYYLTYAQIMLGVYEKAFETIRPHLDGGSPDYNLLELLLVISEKSRWPLSEKARKRYTESVSVLDEGIELSDVINTGTVYSADAKKQKLDMKGMPLQTFLDLFKKDQGRPITKELLEAHTKAAVIFDIKGLPLMAAASYRLLLAKGHDTERNARNLIRHFRDCGNDIVARQMEKLPNASNTTMI
jgi:glycosyltransferase involved in cell wall biosynthesis